MGLFNSIGEVKKEKPQQRRFPPLFLTYRTKDTDSGLYSWVADLPNRSF